MRCAAGRWRRAPRTTARGGLEPGAWRCGARGDWGWGGRRCLGRWAVVRPERERDRGRRRWPAAMASTPRSLTPERIRTDPAATARESARGGRNRAPRHVRRRVPQPPCAAVRGSAPLVLPAGRSPLAATPPHARGPPRRGRSAPPRRHGGRERAARRGHQRRPRNLCAGGGRGWRGPWGTALGSAAAGSGAGGRDREREGGEGGAREGKAREMGGTERADGLNHD